MERQVRARLTDRAINRKAPESGTLEIWDELLPGFGLRIGKSRRTYFVMARINGKQVRRKIGTTDTHTLAEARDAARDFLRSAARGIDPKEEEERERREEARADMLMERGTFGAVATNFMQERAKGLRSRGEMQRKLDVDILPTWRDIPVAEIRRADVKALFMAKAETSPVAANRLLSMIRTIFNYAIDEELIEANPAARIKPETETERERYLSEAEIKAFWHGLDSAPIEAQVRHALKFLLVTGQRRGEVAGASWEEFDFEKSEWTIPGSRTKNRRTHVVPLSDLALELLSDMASNGDDFVFPGAFGNKSLSPYSISQGMLKSREALGLSDNPAKPHDLRRTFASGLAQLGFPRLTISRLLNHTEGGVTSIYDRHSYSEEMATAAQAWANRLREIVGGEAKPENVVKLRGAGE
jgi:integrase